MSSPPPAQSGEEVEFEIEKEVWNVYELSDRSMIRGRSILTRLMKAKVAPEQLPVSITSVPGGEVAQFGAEFQNLFSVSKASPLSIGKPENLSPQELASREQVEVQYVPYTEDWNVYRLVNGSKLKIKLVVSSVFKVKDTHDLWGYPVYIVNSTNAIAPVPKPKSS